MKTFRIINPLVKAWQWFPGVPIPGRFCGDQCYWLQHGEIVLLEPGDWVVSSLADGQEFVVADAEFKLHYAEESS